MADCGKTEVFFKELKRMCGKFNSTCVGCKIYSICFDTGCYSFIKDNPQEAIEIVQKWSDQNPIKTRQSEFLKMFPEAKLDDYDILILKPCMIDVTCQRNGICCADCREEYWLAEVE